MKRALPAARSAPTLAPVLAGADVPLDDSLDPCPKQPATTRGTAQSAKSSGSLGLARVFDHRNAAEWLRGKFKAEYQSLILPILVIRRLECALID